MIFSLPQALIIWTILATTLNVFTWVLSDITGLENRLVVFVTLGVIAVGLSVWGMVKGCMAMKQGAIGTRDPEKAWGNCGNLSMKRWIFFFHFEQYLVFSVVSHREFISIISFTNLIPVTVKLNLFERRMQYWILNVWTTRALKDSKGRRLIKRLMFDWESYQDLSSCLESLRQPEDLKLAILSVVPSRPQGLNSQVWYTPTHRFGIFSCKRHT